MSDAAKTITVYNDNKSAVNWASSGTLKGTKHINLRECCIREQHQNKTLKVTHIPGVINSSDLFTKELKDAVHGFKGEFYEVWALCALPPHNQGGSAVLQHHEP
jgi:hypothetical protein